MFVQNGILGKTIKMDIYWNLVNNLSSSCGSVLITLLLLQ